MQLHIKLHIKKVINVISWPSLHYKNQSNTYEKEVIRGINSKKKQVKRKRREEEEEEREGKEKEEDGKKTCTYFTCLELQGPCLLLSFMSLNEASPQA